MLETIAATCRCLACDARLAIIHALCHQTELRASAIAREVGISAELAAHHLRRLTACAVIRPRRSGRYIYYRLTPTPAPPSRFAPVGLLRRAFRDTAWPAKGWDKDEVVHITFPQAAALAPHVVRAMDIVFDATTAFGQVRRLQLMRFLACEGQAGVEKLTQQLSMSPQACWRHLDKLVRRGYIRAARRGVWALCERGETPFHEALLAEAKASWGESLTVVQV